MVAKTATVAIQPVLLFNLAIGSGAFPDKLRVEGFLVMQMQRLIDGVMGLGVAIASCSVTQLQPLASVSGVGGVASVAGAAIAAPQSTVAFEHMGLPRTVADTAQRTMQRDYQNRVKPIRIVHAKPATWKDCDPDLPQGRFSYRPCQPTPRQGWQVTVLGEFPTIAQTILRTYYIDHRSWAVAVPLQNVSAEMRSQIASTLRVPASALELVAATEETMLPATACPPSGFCPIPPKYLGWRILAVANGRDRIVRLGGIGSPIQPNPEFTGNPATLGTLSKPLANAVLQDAQARLNTPELMRHMAANAPVAITPQIQTIQAITWNACSGGSGPSQPMRGTCPNRMVSGWRMVVVGGVRSEPLRLVYYIPADANGSGSSWIPEPDGLQSLSTAVQGRILTQIAQEAKIPTSRLRLFWTDARLFDRCLNLHQDVPSCGTDIRPGWAVQILVDQVTSGSSIHQPLWVYHSNITGTDVRLVQRRTWVAPPMMAPVQP